MGLAEARLAMREKVQRAAKRGTGCHLTAGEVDALDRLEAGGDWWEDGRLARTPR